MKLPHLSRTTPQIMSMDCTTYNGSKLHIHGTSSCCAQLCLAGAFHGFELNGFNELFGEMSHGPEDYYLCVYVHVEGQEKMLLIEV